MKKTNLIMATFLLMIMTGCGGGNSNKNDANISTTGTPDTNITSNGTDAQAPIITIQGKNPIYRAIGNGYVDEGATAKDAVDGVVTVTVTGEVDTSTVGTYEITYTAEDKAGNKATAVRKVIVQNITHNGVTYGIIVSPITGKIWLDKNLGAAEPCNDSYNYDACEGDFYQWGRNADGHEDSMSDTSTTKVSGLESSDGKFIIGHADWSTSTHRGANWSKTDGSSVCPVGFRVPTIDELEAEEDKDAYIVHLKLPLGRQRTIMGNYEETTGLGGPRGGLWSATVSGFTQDKDPYGNLRTGVQGLGAYTKIHEFGTNTYKFTTLRANGYNVRCIKP